MEPPTEGGQRRGWLMVSLFLLSFPLVARRRGRLGDIDRIGGGKAVLQALLERLLEPALLRLVAVPPALLVELVLGGIVWNPHRCPPFPPAPALPRSPPILP